MGLSTAPSKGVDGGGVGPLTGQLTREGTLAAWTPTPPHPIAGRTKEAHAAQETRRGPDLG